MMGDRLAVRHLRHTRDNPLASFLAIVLIIMVVGGGGWKTCLLAIGAIFWAWGRRLCLLAGLIVRIAREK
jgi:hypothetical protein